MKIQCYWGSDNWTEHELPLVGGNLTKEEVFTGVIDGEEIHYVNRNGNMEIVRTGMAERVVLVDDWSDLGNYDKVMEYWTDNPENIVF